VSGKSALIGICLAVVVGVGAGAYVLFERHFKPRAPVAERTLPPLDFGRGRGLSYTFVDTGGALQTVDARDDIPDDAREFVKVSGTSVRRTERTASLVYVADLRVQAADGGFPYKVMTDAQFLELVLPQSSERTLYVKYEPEPEPPPPPRVQKPRGKGARAKAPPLPELIRGSGGRAAGSAEAEPGEESGRAGGKSVTLYTTAWCPACTQARSWFRQRGIPFVEHDIEKDQQADREYAQKCARIGQAPGRVPGVEIGGRLMIGFAPGRVESLLRR